MSETTRTLWIVFYVCAGIVLVGYGIVAISPNMTEEVKGAVGGMIAIPFAMCLVSTFFLIPASVDEVLRQKDADKHAASRLNQTRNIR